MRKVGLHQRITSNLTELIKKAVRLELSCFQFFVTDRKTGKVINPTSEDLRTFLSYRWINFNNLYLHSSYFINLADIKRTYHPLLVRELRIAKMLECSHIVIHAGTVRTIDEKNEGIEAVARVMNYLIKREPDIQFLLENTAFGQLAIGSTIEDFHRLLTKVDQPDRIGFCIDTVHAHVAGYDIVSEESYSKFITELEKMIGLERIKLIHLNETRQEYRSYSDVHCCIGEKGAQLGELCLKRFMSDKRLGTAEFLTELPEIPEEDERRIMDILNTWMMQCYRE